MCVYVCMYDVCALIAVAVSHGVHCVLHPSLQVCAALANLAYADENKYEIAKGGAVTPLIVRAQSEDMEVARQACACLANLAEMPDNQVRNVLWNDTDRGALADTLTRLHCGTY